MLANELRFRVLLISISLTALSSIGSAQEGAVTVRIDNEGRSFFGQPLGWDGKQIALLRLDGQLTYVPANSEKVKIVAKEVTPYSPKFLRNSLKKEYGKRYDVSITDNFIVVHPWGKPDFWAQPFEDFHERFVYYFENQGVEVSKSKFPLTAIVLRSRSDFDRHFVGDQGVPPPRIAAEDDRPKSRRGSRGGNINSRGGRSNSRGGSSTRQTRNVKQLQVAGYYSRRTNQLVTYDPEQRLRYKEESWLYGSTTVIHEAAHQSAFNLGLHNRFSPPPKWLSEGLACLFEARGVHHASKYTEQFDRVSAKYLRAVHDYYKHGQGTGGLAQIIMRDAHFQKKPEFAYALAWGITFYLTENHPQAYFEFLKKDAARKNFAPYSPQQRLQDFATAFGADINDVENQMRDFLLGEQ